MAILASEIGRYKIRDNICSPAMYILLSLTSSTVDSEKKSTEIPDDLWAVAVEAAVTTVNFSKNQLSTWPHR